RCHRRCGFSVRRTFDRRTARRSLLLRHLLAATNTKRHARTLRFTLADIAAVAEPHSLRNVAGGVEPVFPARGEQGTQASRVAARAKCACIPSVFGTRFVGFRSRDWSGAARIDDAAYRHRIASV